MGYTTTFAGSIRIDPPLNPAEIRRLTDFADERHEGGGFPGIWCQWVATEDGEALEWDGGEKFYNAAAWMKYLISTYLADTGIQTHTLNGEIDAQGEDADDVWRLYVEDNVVSVATGTIVYGDPVVEPEREVRRTFVITLDEQSGRVADIAEKVPST